MVWLLDITPLNLFGHSYNYTSFHNQNDTFIQFDTSYFVFLLISLGKELNFAFQGPRDRLRDSANRGELIGGMTLTY